MFEVPKEFNKNHPDVQRMGTPTESGGQLIAYMAERLGRRDLAGLAVLDFGCGCRFAEAITNLQCPLERYVGIDVDADMVQYLTENVPDKRLSFFAVSHYNPMYNPNGEKITPSTTLPIGDQQFDLICMFSVITHQLPVDAKALFTLLRRHAKPDCSMFFSASITEDVDEYREADPEHPTALSEYSRPFLESLLAQAGWEVVNMVPRQPRGLPILESFLCRVP